MAQMLLRQVGENPTAGGAFELLFAGIIFGSDVPGGIFQFTEGGSEVMRVPVPNGATQAQVGNAVRTAADTKAASQGLTIVAGGVFVPSFAKV